MSGNTNPNVVTDGLVLCLDAGNSQSYPGSGTTWTDLAGSYNTTLINGPTFSSANGGSIDFDASNDYTDTGWGSGLNPTTASYSFEAWVKADNTTTFQMFLAPSDHGSNQRAYFSKHNTGKWLIGIGGATDASIWSTQDVTTNWTHMAIILNSTDNKGRLYINGVLEDTGDAYTSYTFNQNFNIGRGGSGSSPGFYWGGLISNVKIYASKALTATEILQNYNAHKARYGL